MITQPNIGSRPVRRPRSELKQIVLEAAVEVLRELPPSLSVETLSYVRVFEHLKEKHGVTVTRGSVHERIWSSVQDFRMETLLFGMAGTEIAGLEQLEKLVNESVDGSDLSTVTGRQECFATMFRNVDPYFDFISQPVEPWTGFALKILATIPDKGDGPARQLADAMGAFDKEREDTFVGLFGAVFGLLGMQVKSDLDMTQDEAIRSFFRISNDLIEGQRLYEQGVDLDRPRMSIRRSGGVESWPQLGYAIYSMALSMFTFVELPTN